jgi:glycosyltransferase involved in cell wall biosynthesis
MLLGYPNLLASRTLSIADDGLPEMLDDADIVLAREPWQTSYVLEATDTETPVIFSSHNVETERFGDIRQPLFEGYVKRRVTALERRAVEDSNLVVCTSQRDARVYREMYNSSGPIIVVPNGTYESDLREHRSESAAARECRQSYGIPPDTTVCVFMGSHYKPNAEAAHAVVDIAEEMRNDGKPVHFLILGSVGNALSRRDLPANVTVTGYIEDDFEAHLDAADIGLNPMQSGGGTNIKLIDFFARSLPVVSTPFGARGIDANDGEELVVANLDAFPEAITLLADASKRRREIGRSARHLAGERYTWEAGSRTLRERIVDEFGPF